MPALRRRTLVVNIVLVIVILLGLGFAAATIVGGGPRELPPTTASVQRGTIVASVAAAGEVVSPGERGLEFATSGRLVALEVEVGDVVEAGQELARIEAALFEEQIEVAHATLAAAKSMRTQIAAGPTAERRRVLDLDRQLAALQLQQAETALALAEDQREAAFEVLDLRVETAEDTVDRARETRDNTQDLYEDDCDDDPVLEVCLRADHAVDEARAAREAARRDRDQARVREEQVLAQARDQVAQARVALQLADARRAAETAGPGRGDLAQLDAEITRAHTQLMQAKRALEDTVLVAPADGVIGAVHVEVGMSVAAGAGQPAILLTDAGDRAVDARFAEADATRIEVGQPAAVTFDAVPGVSANGRVQRIDPLPTLTGNLVQYGVRIAIDDMPDGIRLGQTTTVEIVIGRAEDALYVPATAVTTVGTRSTVTVYDPTDEIEPQSVRDVEVGVRSGQHVEIVAGLSEGDEVVLPTRGAGTLPEFGPGMQEPASEPVRGNRG
jgi:membrane fusion protein, macrolide-specific efflux system